MNPAHGKSDAGPESRVGEVIRQGEFYWHVDAGGYALRWGRTSVEKPPHWWTPGDDDGPDCSVLEAEAEWALVRRAEVEECRDENGALLHWGLNQRETTPLLDHPALFREFAGVDYEDRFAVLAFANLHGFLGRYHPFYFDPPAPEIVQAVPNLSREAFTAWLSGLAPRPDLGDDTWLKIHVGARKKSHFTLLNVHVSEPLSLWRDQISLMRHTVALWDLVANASPEIGNWVMCVHDGAQRRLNEGDAYRPRPSDDMWRWYVRGEEGRGRIYLDATPRPPEPDSPFQMAAAHVRFVISNQLYRRVQPALLGDKAAGSPSGSSQLMMFPDDLLAAMWLQFAQAVAGNTRYRQCRQCQKWFGYSETGDARVAKRLFCSDACKSREYRLKQEAIRLREEGHSVPKIAEKLAVNVAFVAGWLLNVGLHKKPEKKSEKKRITGEFFKPPDAE